MATNGLCTTRWSPQEVIDGESPNGHFCMVLNRKVDIPVEVTRNIWENAALRCTVDGGTNRWRDFVLSCKGTPMKAPDLITGDFDSITDETINFFKDTRRVHTPDQNETDFTKAIRQCLPLMREKQITDIIVFQDNCGRFDHTIANINTLYKMQGPNLNVFLLSGNSLTWLLRPGKHSIQIPSDLVKNTRWCALMPIGQPATCLTTRGLKWNLENSSMRFGELVSTSNSYSSELVEIECREPLVWSMGLFRFHDD